jgi:hypothetical protein
MFRCRLSYEQWRKLINERRNNYCSVTVQQLCEVFSNIPMQIYCYGITPLGKDLDLKSWHGVLGYEARWDTQSSKLWRKATPPGACRE